MMFAGPDIPAGGIIDAARAVDLAPTLLDILHVPTQDADFDGESLWQELQNADAQISP
jgi:arylsulfatase A-like enzyme